MKTDDTQSARANRPAIVYPWNGVASLHAIDCTARHCYASYMHTFGGLLLDRSKSTHLLRNSQIHVVMRSDHFGRYAEHESSCLPGPLQSMNSRGGVFCAF